MNEEIEIRSDIPAPQSTGISNVQIHRDIFSKMKIGDSVVLVGNSSQSMNPMAMRHAAESMGGRIRAQMVEGQKGRVRVWRVK